MSESAFIHRPFDGHLTIENHGVVMGRLKALGASAAFRNWGDFENVEVSSEIDEREIWSPQTAQRSLRSTIVNKLTPSITIEFNQLVPDVRTLLLMSDPNLAYGQTASADTAFTIDDAVPGGIYRLGKRKVSDVKITGYDLGVHFQVDGETGHLEIIKHPDDSPSKDVSGTFDAASIAGRKLWGFGSDLDIRVELMFRQTNEYGPRALYEFHDVGFRLNDALNLGSNSGDANTFTLEGKVYADPTQPAAEKYFRVTDLP